MSQTTVSFDDSFANNSPNDLGLLIDVAEVARILNISQRSVWRLRSAGDIVPPIRIGHLVRWRRVDIIEWINQGCPPARKPR